MNESSAKSRAFVQLIFAIETIKPVCIHYRAEIFSKEIRRVSILLSFYRVRAENVRPGNRLDADCGFGDFKRSFRKRFPC